MKKIYLFLNMIFCLGGVFAQSIFNNPITGTNPNTSNPYITGQTVDANITVSGIGRGTGITGTNSNDRYNATQWNLSTFDANDYYEFTLKPNSGKVINFANFVYTGQASNTGPVNFAFRSSLDGYLSDIGSPSAAGATIDLSAPTYQNISSAITFRIYGWGGNNTVGTFSINDFTFNGNLIVLPITIEYLNGTNINNGHLLTWKVNCSNSVNNTFNLERSNDGRTFNSIFNTTESALRCQQSFNFIDNNPLPNRNYYRLKMTDNNGKFTYSNIITLLNKASGFDIANILPSVIKNTAMVNVSAAQKMQINFVITDFAGRQIQKQTNKLIAGSNPIEMNFSNLPKGIYQLIGYTSEGKSAIVRFIKE